jgi:glutaconate CoA-transferase subunit B
VTGLATDELMAIVMSRQVRDGDFVAHGAAVPLAAAALMLAQSLHAPNVDFFYQGTLTPRETDLARLALDPELAYASARGFFSQAQMLDFELRGRCDLQFLRPLQIDPVGNVNVSLIGTLRHPLHRFHGIAVADAMAVVRRVCLYVTEHSPRVFAAQLDFRTGLGHPADDAWRRRLAVPGGGPCTVVTPLAVLDFSGPGRTMGLSALLPGASVADVRAATGFKLFVPDGVAEIAAPTAQEVDARHRVAPLATRRMEFRQWRDEARRVLEAARSATPPVASERPTE